MNPEKITFNPLIYSRILKELALYERNTLDNLLKLGECYFVLLSMVPWKHDGTGARNVVQWIEQELKRKKSMVFNLIALWKKCGKHLEAHPELKSTTPSHIYPLLPYMKDEESTSTCLNIAYSNTLEGIGNIIKEWKGIGTATDVCSHEDMENWFRCTCCGKFMKEV